jgi:TM2 domain-containing membrane protein YozV
MNPEQKPEVQTTNNLKPAVNVISDVVPALLASTPPPTVAAPIAPTPPEVEPVVTPVKDKRRHFLAVFFFSFLFGVFGVDRFYLGKFWTGLLKLLTFGGLGIWAMIDLSLVMSGAMRDRQGNEMIDAERYKKFAKRTVLAFTLIVFILVFVIGGLSVYYTIQFIQNGGIEQLMEQIPGFDKLQLLQDASGQQEISPQEIQDLMSKVINEK